VHSGRTGKLLLTGFGEQPGDGLGGGAMIGCGDIDGDGVPDFAGSSHGQVIFPGVARVFSGRTGQAIYSWRSFVGSGFGVAMQSADLDLDGVQDFIVGSLEKHPTLRTGGHLAVYSGRDGSLVTRIYSPGLPDQYTYFGSDCQIGRPQPGNPFPVFAAGESRYGRGGGWLYAEGRVTMFRSAPFGVARTGPGCAGGLGAAPGIGFRALSDTAARIHLTGAPPNTTGICMLGISGDSFGNWKLPFELTGLGMPGCHLLESVDLVFPVSTGMLGNDRGYGFLDVPRLGQPLFAQWLAPGTGPIWQWAMSPGLRWR
jgi:hypothetical protein